MGASAPSDEPVADDRATDIEIQDRDQNPDHFSRAAVGHSWRALKCIHTPVYGTRSSTLLALDEARVLDYRFADGKPCTTAFSRVWPDDR